MQNNYPNERGSPAWHTDGIRLTKRCAIAGAERPCSARPAAGSAREGTFDHHLGAGYYVEGWFLEPPCVGRRMVVLRFNRNGVFCLGFFFSSAVTSIGDDQIRTVNSVYQIEAL